MIRAVTIFLLVVIVFAPLQSRAQQSAGSASIKDIGAALDSQSVAWNRGDIQGYMQYYWHSDSLLFTSGGNVRRGWTATLDKYKKSYNSRAKMGSLKFSELEIHPLSGESAWVFGHWELRRKNDHPGGVFTLILRKFADGWKIVHDHTSAESGK